MKISDRTVAVKRRRAQAATGESREGVHGDDAESEYLPAGLRIGFFGFRNGVPKANGRPCALRSMIGGDPIGSVFCIVKPKWRNKS